MRAFSDRRMIQTHPSPPLRGFGDDVVLPVLQQLRDSIGAGPKEKFFNKHYLRWIHWFGIDPAAFRRELKDGRSSGNVLIGPIERFFLKNVPLKPAVKAAFERKFEELPKDLPRRLILLRALVSAHRNRMPLSWLEPDEREPGADMLDRASIAFLLSELVGLGCMAHDDGHDVLRSAHLKESFMDFIARQLPGLVGPEASRRGTAFPGLGNQSLPQWLDWTELFVVSRRENPVFHDLFLRVSRSQFTAQNIAPTKFNSSFSLTKKAKEPAWSKIGRAPRLSQSSRDIGNTLLESVRRSIAKLSPWINTTLAHLQHDNKHRMLRKHLDDELSDSAVPFILKMDDKNMLKAAALLRVLQLELGRQKGKGPHPAICARIGQVAAGLSGIIEAKKSKAHLGTKQSHLISELSRIYTQLCFWLEDQKRKDEGIYSVEVSLNLWDILKTMRCPDTQPFNCLHPIYLGPFRFDLIALACLPYQHVTLLRSEGQVVGYSMSHGVRLDGETPALIRDHAFSSVPPCVYSSLIERLDRRISDLLGIPILNPSGSGEASIQEFEFPSHPFTVCFDFLFDSQLGPNGGHRPDRKIPAHIIHPPEMPAVQYGSCGRAG